VRSRTTHRFRQALATLPGEVHRTAKRAYTLFKENPRHPSLRFRLVHPTEPIYSIRVGLHHRAIGWVEGDVVVWFWIGSHADYDALISQLRGRNPLT
jgi:hypothetical protein